MPISADYYILREYVKREVQRMIEKRIKFMTSGQLMSFCNICQKMKSDIDVTDITN